MANEFNSLRHAYVFLRSRKDLVGSLDEYSFIIKDSIRAWNNLECKALDLLASKGYLRFCIGGRVVMRPY